MTRLKYSLIFCTFNQTKRTNFYIINSMLELFLYTFNHYTSFAILIHFKTKAKFCRKFRLIARRVIGWNILQQKGRNFEIDLTSCYVYYRSFIALYVAIDQVICHFLVKLVLAKGMLLLGVF